MKLLLVTFPVDLGNLTLERNLINLFEGRCDLKVHRFAAEQSATFDRCLPDHKANRIDRFRGCLTLRRVVREAQAEGRTVLFHNISPALFSYGAWKSDSTFIVTDWTRKLHETPTDRKSPPWLTALHSRVLRSVQATICLTDAVQNSVTNDYGVPADRTVRARMPFDLDRFQPGPERPGEKIRLLFVGGALKRKGGDILLRAFREELHKVCRLTFVSNSPVEPFEGLEIVKNLTYGDPRHSEIFASHDIFVLPTLREGYPQVIGEAAAAGLAVITTRFALGAPDIIQDGVNGFICRDQEETIRRVKELLASPERVAEFKRASRAHMERWFSRDALFSAYREILWQAAC